MKRDEKLVRYEQHRDNAEHLLHHVRQAPTPEATMADLALAQVHATMALLYLTDLLSDDA